MTLRGFSPSPTRNNLGAHSRRCDLKKQSAPGHSPTKQKATEAMAKQLIKSGNRIKGFIWECSKNGWSYAFGKPSAPSHIVFYGNNAPLTESEARQRVENA